jgi:hypothetical protein
MRIGLAGFVMVGACVLGGCMMEDSSSSGSYGGGGGGWGSGWGGGGGTTGFGCQADSECGGLTCARTGECLAASEIRIVHTNWTLKGAAASDATCTKAPLLAITFTSPQGEMFGYAPVPCDAGKHTVDKLPIRFNEVQLARENDYSGGAYGTFDATGNATLDLPY